jgi:hypothetical protein
MTREQQTAFRRQAEAIAEYPYLKLVSRVAMTVASLFGLPIAVWFVSVSYNAFTRLERLQSDQATQIQLLIRDGINDRANAGKLFEAEDKRIDIVSSHITETRQEVETSFARINDVRAGFDRRDDAINRLDNRVSTLEERTYSGKH